MENQNNIKDNKNYPLVSFCLFTYMQEEYIREAIEGAFSQTYSPLEIILSDDCSIDRTFEIMKEMVEKYKGPHRILLNRTKTNIGLTNHINEILKISQGEFIVIAAGDDISYPSRTEILVNKWINLSKPCAVFHSSVDRIDKFNNPFNIGIPFSSPFHDNMNNPIDVVRDMKWVLGCSEAIDRRIISEFPDINQNVVNEDAVFAFRGSIRDGVIYVNQSLLKYRINVGISNEKNRLKALRKNSFQFYAISTQYLEDFFLQKLENDKLKNEILKNNYKTKLISDAYNASFIGYYRTFIRSLCKVTLKIMLYSIFYFIKSNTLRYKSENR